MGYSRYIPKHPNPDMSVNTEVKGTLAKLLATENLHVEHRKISTAYFNTETRVLALPIWKDVTGDVYDLLVGHEVGHALYTPNLGFGNAPKDYVNVIEDARVERKMKTLYPGLRKSFYLGYQELNNKDFFDLKSDYRELSDWKLIDRINIYFKVGTVCDDLPLNFNEQEQVWVDRIATTETYEEVVQVAEELYNWVREVASNDTETPPPPSQKSNSGSASEDVEYTPQSSDEEGDSSDPIRNDIDYGNDQNTDSELDEDTLDESETERAWNANQHMLIDDDAKEWIYLDLPKVNLDNIVVPYKVITHKLSNYFIEDEDSEPAFTRSVQKSNNVFVQYKRDAQPTVNHLVKQFEMKKSAEKYSRSAESKTGVINTNALYKYKLTDDIFRRTTIVSDGKNHGLVFLLDWSGSMSKSMMDTIRQLYNLIWFCRKVQIPFEVYAFESGTGFSKNYSSYGENHKAKENCIGLAKDFRLLQFFTSSMTKKELDEQMRLVWLQCWGMCSEYYTAHGYLREYTLGGTPLAEAVICIRDLVNKFVKKNNVQKVNVISLTDGESNPMFYNQAKLTNRFGDAYWNTSMLCHNLNKVFILRDPVTKYQRKIDASPYLTTKEIVSFYREITDYNWIGFRLCSKREANTMISFYGNNSVDYHTSWTKKKFVEIHNKCGFTVQYIMPNQNIGSGTSDLEVKPKKEVASKAELTRAFKKHMGSKMTNKTILNKFVEMIA